MNIKLPALSTWLSTLFGAGGVFTTLAGAFNLGNANSTIDTTITSLGAALITVAAAYAHSHSSKKALIKVAASVTPTTKAS